MRALGRIGGCRAGVRLAVIAAAIGTMSALVARPASAQWSRTYESTYLPGSFNWQFRERYPAADRLFNAFDYGHAILYETLWTSPSQAGARLETNEFDFITTRLLPNPPRLPLVESAIEPNFAKLAPEAKAMLDWAHLLHRQIYDVWADPSIAVADKDLKVAELVRYYRSRKDLAFSARPKSMDVMDGHFYSLAFRQQYPKFNGLIWAYHWMQIGLYEPLLTGRTDAERAELVDATVGRLRQMLLNAPTSTPYLMPMTPAIAPTFARRYPDAGAIFDNLHMMHDVLSDILTSPEVPQSAKRKEILEAAATFRSDTAFAIPFETWLQMGEIMGLNNMGGPAVHFAAALPQPTVARGASMAGMVGMSGMQHGGAGTGHGATSGSGMAGMPGMGAGNQARADTGMAGMNMPGSSRGAMSMSMPGDTSMSGMTISAMMAMHERMMADPVIRERMMTDPVLQQMMKQMTAGQPMPGMKMSGTMGQGTARGGKSMPGMKGMAMPGNASMNPMPENAEDRRQATEFIVRMLADPTVESRIHSDPALQKLWMDPDVQKRLVELRREQAAAGAGKRDSVRAPMPAMPMPRPDSSATHKHP
ncbi:MAG: hypothetical protein M3Z05_11935 [Gemmatimonadota bacterium]|nr:hypothetical protein [Gemmatimonadota bacterium]